MNPLIRYLEINSTAKGWRTIMNCMRAKSSLSPIALIPVIWMAVFALITNAHAVSDSYLSAGTYNWTAPTGVTSVDVEVWGGGGAGGGQSATSDGGGGGGGGAYSKTINIPVVPGNSYTVVVGAGGVGVTAGTGGTGGDSYFINAGTLLAKGGLGGEPSSGTPPAGGAGGSAAAGVGSIRYSGGNGGRGRDHNTGQGGPGGSSAGTAADGTNGPSPWSTVTAQPAPVGGGIGGNGGTAGNNGSAPASGNGGGGGGSGDRTTGGNRTGGNGADGKVVITYSVVTSITRTNPSPTAASTVSWTVTFDRSISGVNASNFTLVNTGLGGAPAITSVTGSGTTWTVTASTGTGSGTLGLNMTSSTGATPGVGGLPFVGQVYTILPTVSSITRADPSPTGAASVSWTVTFSANVSGVNSGNFTLVNSGLGGTPAITSVTGSGTTWTVTASTGSGSGTLGLNMTGSSGIVPGVLGLPFTGEVYTVLRPTVTSFTLASTDPTIANTTVSWTIVFSAAVTGVDATDFVLVEAGGVTGSSITAVTGSGTTWTVSANTGTSDTGTLGLNLIDDDSITNAAGTPLGGVGSGNGNYVGPYYTLVPPAPTLAKTASAAAAVVGDVVTFTITASNPYADPLTDVVITDVLPAGMTYQTHVATLGSAGASGQTVTWTIPSLPAMGSAQLTLAVSLSQQGPLTNTVTSPGATSASASILVLASAVTHFRMDEPVASWSGTPGEVIDSGGTELHGRRIPSPTSSSTNVVDPTPSIISQHPSVIGGFCNAAYFDRQAIVEVADSPLFDYTTQLSASAWIYPTAYPSGSSDLYSILSNDVNYEFHLNQQGRLYWWWNASTLTSATTIPLNQWTHVAITFDSSAGVRRQRIYINGVMDGNTNNWQGTLQPNNCNFYIGGDIATGAACSILSARNFAGMIDEVKLYSFELSPEEVVADMTLGRACSGTFDHVRIEHDGSGSICAPERITLRACMDSDCTALYPGNVTVNLSPSGWVDGNTFTFSGGIASRQLSWSTPGTITLGTNSVSPTPAFATRCFNGSTETCQMTFAAASCAFDAVEPGAQPQSPIYTKLAGVPFNIDVLALLNSTTINTAYTGTVAVDLVDTSSSACPTGSGLTAASNITYVAGDAGRKTVSFNYPSAARNVRVRATVGASAPACSTDNFAIRPQAFAVSSTNATNVGLGGAPIITAGAAFNLTAASVAGYDGTPLVDNTKVVGTPNAGVLGGTFSAAPAATGTASGNSFTYTEVGHFGLNQHAVYDSTFTLVDQPDDCNSGFSNILSGGKYGCSIGSNPVAQTTGSSGFGRFVPARLNISNNSPTFTPACGANFTYLGQPFSFTTDPVFTVTALNTMGNVTTNYAGGYWNLTSTLSSRSYSNNAATTLSLSAPSAGNVAWTGTNVTDGVGTATLSGVQLQYEKPAAPHVPFDADVALNLTAGDLTDGDGVCYDPESDGTCNAYTIGSTTGTELRFGRLRAQNTYGPELMTLNVPLQAEYYTAGDYFTVNALDGCTVLTEGSNLLLSTDGINWVSGDSGVTIGGGTSTATLGSAAPLSGGDAGLSFSAPGAGNTGQVDLRTNIGTAYPWLLHDWDGDGVDDEGQARINFGLYRGSPHHIYLRERY